ncbi:MAG: hypothetical protein KBD16_04550 [Candidatus Pacebacteria bacterium]|nr:hypothetical protein [Candidatus Paceibacterota bacterium]
MIDTEQKTKNILWGKRLMVSSAVLFVLAYVFFTALFWYKNQVGGILEFGGEEIGIMSPEFVILMLAFLLIWKIPQILSGLFIVGLAVWITGVPTSNSQ